MNYVLWTICQGSKQLTALPQVTKFTDTSVFITRKNTLCCLRGKKVPGIIDCEKVYMTGIRKIGGSRKVQPAVLCLDIKLSAFIEEQNGILRAWDPGRICIIQFVRRYILNHGKQQLLV